jgi:hypothetical protein
VIAITPAAVATTAASADSKALLDGKDLAAWKIPPAEVGRHWRVGSDHVVNDGSGSPAVLPVTARSFELELEYHSTAPIPPLALNGVPLSQIRPASADAREPSRTDARWHAMRLVQIGHQVSLWQDGRPMLEHGLTRPKASASIDRVQLLPAGRETRWRHLRVREIGIAEANATLAAADSQGFRPIFNGRDLEGWRGATDSVEVVDGALVWRAGKTGVPYWHEVLTDFQVRFLFKLPPGGNNGLAIRYPGKGLAAYDGMTELQIIDENYHAAKNLPADRQLDPRQNHGSAYGMVAAERGHQYPIGEWNFQEVTVKGSRLTVVLNGAVILDTDLSDVDPAGFMNNRPHPGRTRQEGYFGLAGHKEPVAFCDLSIRTLR